MWDALKISADFNVDKVIFKSMTVDYFMYLFLLFLTKLSDLKIQTKTLDSFSQRKKKHLIIENCSLMGINVHNCSLLLLIP